MFSSHNINHRDLSGKNLILLFLTIVFGFGSVITLASVTIDSDISNARQTIKRVTMTSDGTEGGTRYLDFNYSGNGKTYINSTALTAQNPFSGKVLGIDANGDLVYALSTNLVVSGAGGATAMYWTGVGYNIYNTNVGGNVGIGTETPTGGKLHIMAGKDTELYLEENSEGFASSIHLKNALRTRSIGNHGISDLFYIGQAGETFDLSISTGGNIGIGGLVDMSGKLHVKSDGNTELYLEETMEGRAANINFKSFKTTRGIGGDNDPEVFYIGLVNSGIYFAIEPTNGYVGIGTTEPKERLQIDDGNVQISNLTGKVVLGTDSAGKIIASTSGQVYNYISGFALSGPTGATGATGATGPSGLLTSGSTAGVTPYRNGSAWVVNSTNIYNNGGNVGIGTASPGAKLQVVGNFIAGSGHGSITSTYNSSILGGYSNSIGGTHSSIGGGSGNTNNGDYSTIGGGTRHIIYASNEGAFIGGGDYNQVNDDYGFIGGGGENRIFNGATYGFVGGGNKNDVISNLSSIVGGINNVIYHKTSSQAANFIGGGESNIITGDRSVIVGGDQNRINNSERSFIGAGVSGFINSGYYGFIGAGAGNKITNGADASSIIGGSTNTITGNSDYSFIGGGVSNTITTSWNTSIGGGQSNIINGANYSTIAGGYMNSIYTAQNAFIGGGDTNSIKGTSTYSVIPGGYNNLISGAINSFAAGIRAKNTGYDYTFVRNSDNTKDFSAKRNNSFLINAPITASDIGGVGINTNNPQYSLDVSGSIYSSATIYGQNMEIAQNITANTIQITGSQATCSSSYKGMIVFSGDNSFYGCNGTNRRKLDN